MIRLVCGESELSVSVSQAEGIFHIQKETNISNWQLPEDSPYQLVNGKLIKSGSSEIIPRPAKKKRG
jgi:hypothetical protein